MAVTTAACDSTGQGLGAKFTAGFMFDRGSGAESCLGPTRNARKVASSRNLTGVCFCVCSAVAQIPMLARRLQSRSQSDSDSRRLRMQKWAGCFNPLPHHSRSRMGRNLEGQCITLRDGPSVCADPATADQGAMGPALLPEETRI
eukprot:354692-Chlamydomonas_euryale.AAC.3